MNNSLQVFDYNGKVVRTVEKNNDVWFVAKDVCDILDIQNSRDSIAKVLDDDEKGVAKIYTPGGFQDMTVISEAGLYTLTLRSNKEEAKPFRRWVTHDVLPQIHKTGTYTVNPSPMSRDEYELKLNSLNLERARLLNSMLEKPAFPMTPETQTVFAHEVFKLASGHEYLAMLPECTEKFYTATEIGEKLGITANKVGRIAKKHGLEAPEGESNKYGRWIYSKSRNSNREVSSFIYSKDALDWFNNFFMEVNHG